MLMVEEKQKELASKFGLKVQNQQPSIDWSNLLALVTPTENGQSLNNNV
jgi:hypothetical protein